MAHHFCIKLVDVCVLLVLGPKGLIPRTIGFHTIHTYLDNTYPLTQTVAQGLAGFAGQVGNEVTYISIIQILLMHHLQLR